MELIWILVLLWAFGVFDESPSSRRRKRERRNRRRYGDDF